MYARECTVYYVKNILHTRMVGVYYARFSCHKNNRSVKFIKLVLLKLLCTMCLIILITKITTFNFVSRYYSLIHVLWNRDKITYYNNEFNANGIFVFGLECLTTRGTNYNFRKFVCNTVCLLINIHFTRSFLLYKWLSVCACACICTCVCIYSSYFNGFCVIWLLRMLYIIFSTYCLLHAIQAELIKTL